MTRACVRVFVCVVTCSCKYITGTRYALSINWVMFVFHYLEIKYIIDYNGHSILELRKPYVSRVPSVYITPHYYEYWKIFL